MGGLYYPNQTSHVLIGTKTSAGVITPWALTSAYQTEGTTKPTKTFEVGGASEVVIGVSYTTGAAETNNSVDIKVEDSQDGVNFYQLTNELSSAGTSTLSQREFTFVGAAAATTYNLSYRIDVSYKYLRISCKETGVSANAGTVFVEALVSGR